MKLSEAIALLARLIVNKGDVVLSEEHPLSQAVAGVVNGSIDHIEFWRPYVEKYVSEWLSGSDVITTARILTALKGPSFMPNIKSLDATIVSAVMKDLGFVLIDVYDENKVSSAWRKK